MRVLYLDCFSGISGDMTVGALCDLGVAPSAFDWELSKIDLGDFHTHFERQERRNIQGVKFTIHEGAVHKAPSNQGPMEGARHEHHHQDHASNEAHSHGRSHAEIRDLISSSDLSEFVKTRSLSLFERIAVAEGRIHGTPPADVTFHEVGALDSIADIICVCAGIEQLGVERVVVSPLQDGRGWIDSAHGRFPIPAPATIEILAGFPIEQVDQPFEFITPTGAAIVAEFAHVVGLMPRMRITKTGYGVGTRQLDDRPNVLRAVLGELEPTAGCITDTVACIETNLDDLSPEIAGAVMGRLFAAGALDVFFTPVQMKKNRPGFMLTVLCEAPLASRLSEIIFRETSAFGLRRTEVSRVKLERRIESVPTPYGEIQVKIGALDGAEIQVAPEFESCRIASERAGAPLREVYDAAREAWRRDQRLRRTSPAPL